MKKIITSLLMASSALAVFPTAPLAEILVAPTRVVLENGERSTELVLVNKGSEAAAYRISVENRRMNYDGSFEMAKSALEGEKFAKDFVRFTPRRVILEPGGKQTVRISAQLSGLEPGEYRSHLRLQSAPLSAGKTLESVSRTVQDGISIQLIAIRSITIPIIARVGVLDVSVEMGEVTLDDDYQDDESLLVLELKREGDRSTYGDIKIFTDDEAEPVFIARGIALYTPNLEREVRLALPKTLHASLKNKNVRIAYVSSDPQNPKTLADMRTVLR